MRHPFLVTAIAIGLALLIAAEGAALAPAPDAPATLSPKLAKVLEGRTAGTPIGCVNLRQMRSTRIVDETAVIYEESPRRWFVNFPQGGNCPNMTADRAIATRTPSNQLCTGDLVRVFDQTTPIQYGSCALGKFVPYTR